MHFSKIAMTTIINIICSFDPAQMWHLCYWKEKRKLTCQNKSTQALFNPWWRYTNITIMAASSLRLSCKDSRLEPSSSLRKFISSSPAPPAQAELRAETPQRPLQEENGSVLLDLFFHHLSDQLSSQMEPPPHITDSLNIKLEELSKLEI